MEEVELLIDGMHVKSISIDIGIPWTKLRKFIVNDDDVKKLISNSVIKGISFRLHPMNEDENRYIDLLIDKQ